MHPVFYLNGSTGQWEQKMLTSAEFQKLQESDPIEVKPIEVKPIPIQPKLSNSQMMAKAIQSKKRPLPSPKIKLESKIKAEDEDEGINENKKDENEEEEEEQPQQPKKKKLKTEKIVVDKEQSKASAKTIRSFLEEKLQSIQESEPKCPSLTLDLLFESMKDHAFSKFSDTLSVYNLSVAKEFSDKPAFDQKQMETVVYQIKFKQNVHQMIFVHVEVGPSKNPSKKDVISFALKVNKNRNSTRSKSNVYITGEQFLYEGKNKTQVVVSHKDNDSISNSVGGEVRVSGSGSISKILKTNLISYEGATLILSIRRHVGFEKIWCQTKVKQLTSSRKMESNDSLVFDRL